MTQEQINALAALSNEVGHISNDVREMLAKQENTDTALDLLHATLERINDNLTDLRISHANARGEQQRMLEEIVPALRALRKDVEVLRQRLDSEPEGETTVVELRELRDVSAKR